MGTTIEFTAGDLQASGYLALPEAGSGPGVIVVQEWWGLDSGTVAMADRLAAAGFVALAPDLYHGALAGHDEVDRAAELMSSLPIDRAASDMSGAVDHLVGLPETVGEGIGVVGFCMGGMLSFVLAGARPDRVSAVVPFYGFPPLEDGPADLAAIRAVIRGHMAEHDDFFPPEAARTLEAHLHDAGVDATLTVHAGTGHAFMAPHDALGTHDPALAERIWPEVIDFLHRRLG